MIKYRVYDTERNTYLEPLHTRILGNGDLAISSDEFGVEMVRTIAAEGIEHSGYIIEQYTGLRDKNGVEIASGDIVKRRTANYEKQVFEDEYGVVKYEKGSFYVDFGGDIDNLMLRYGKPEVIGNIHENAELLEEK